MFQWFQKQWRELRKSMPGRRFQELHERRQASRQSPFRQRLGLGIGCLVVIAGIAMVPLPGPGWPIVLVGAGLLARESSRAARALDWVEVRFRGLLSWGVCRWQRASFGLRCIVVVIVLAVLGTGAWVVWRLTPLPERVDELLTDDSTPRLSPTNFALVTTATLCL
jgi:uncharacterized protein (TIGR02611 family)